jgi:H+/Cl- antiporter ClcA
MHIKRKRKLIKYLNLLDQPVRFNPFVFSRIFLLWVLLGLIGGLITGDYWIILEFLTDKFALLHGWLVIPTMAISGFLAGLVIHFIGDPGEINLVVNNIRFNKGKLDPRNNPPMILSSLLCVSSGGSLGPEAPMVQVTGSMGSWIGKIFRIKGEELRSLTIAGMASGFTALFGAPLGGSLFSLEILHHKHAVEYYKAIIPALVASSISFIVFVLIIHTGLDPIWKLSAYQYNGASDFVYAVTFAIVATIVGWGLYIVPK